MMKVMLLTSTLLLATVPTIHAQTASALDRWVHFPVAPVPFGPGERVDYRVKFGALGVVGRSSLEVVGIDTVRGKPSYRINFRMKGSMLFAKVNDFYQSWLDIERLQSHRFDQEIHQINYKNHRIFDFHPDSLIWRRADNGQSGELATQQPLDDISFLYYVRTLPLVVGETYSLDRYFKKSGNPVVVKVLRKETVKVPAGEFQTIVVQPIIKTDGLFSEGGKAEVFFSDDERRLVVQLKTKLKIGTLNLEMQSYSPGTRLVRVPAIPTEPTP
jgi:hypothetical protein